MSAGPPRRRRRPTRGIVCAIAATVVFVACTSTVSPSPGPDLSAGSPTKESPLPPSTPEASPTGVIGRPNIVLILTDDQSLSQMGHMATVTSQLADKGMTFRNGFVVNPLCCPSRTTILTGKYSHGTGVYRNSPPYGGFETFGKQDRSTIATWLQKAGYDTALIGKYLNGYRKANYVPPGWDTWDAFSRTGYFDYTISEHGQAVPFTASSGEYSTTFLGAAAVRFIDSAPANRPIFLDFTPKAPHEPAQPEPKYANALPNLPLFRPPNYNEADVSDKPLWLRQTPPLTSSDLAANDVFIRNQFQTLLSVDDQVKAILNALKATGRLSNTFIVFFSDNGLEDGAHRLLHKGVPYEESIHMPLIIRYDPITHLHASTNDAFALNVDFAETFAAVAGISAPGGEGVSLLPLLEGRPVPWRDEFVIEHVKESKKGAPTFCAVRTTRYKYVLYSGGSEELYDLQKDPYELANQAFTTSLATLKARLRADMMRLCSPPPPDWQP